MSNHWRQLMFVILGQAGCVAVGLWLFGAQMIGELRSDYETFVHNDTLSTGEEWLAADSRANSGKPPFGYRTLKTDANGKALDKSDDAARWFPRERFNDRVTRGYVESEGRSSPASAWRLDDGTSAILYRPGFDPAVLTAPLVGRLWPLALMTLLWVSVLQGIVVYLVTSQVREALRNRNTQSAKDTMRQLHQLVRSQDAMIFALAKLADSRDPETGHHLERITTYSRLIAEAARRHPRFATDISAEFVRLIHLASALHDIGKVGIEDRILQKPGPLTADEQNRMERHTLIAADCIDDIVRRVGPSPLLQMAREIALAHHERWDGAGYPRRLRGDEIPLAARIVALADVYDALASRRVYKEPIPHDECVATIRQAAGKHFDPDLVDAWISVEREFEATAAQYIANDSQDSVQPFLTIRSHHDVPSLAPHAPEHQSTPNSPIGDVRHEQTRLPQSANS